MCTKKLGNPLYKGDELFCEMKNLKSCLEPKSNCIDAFKVVKSDPSLVMLLW